MLRSNAASLYGPKTMMYGTLLPSPMIGKKLTDEIRSVGKAGHEVGVHGWDHIRWHDKADRMSFKKVERDYLNARAEFERIFGKPARSSSAGLERVRELAEGSGKLLQTVLCFRHAWWDAMFSQRRRTFSVLEIPSTLPTWDHAELGLLPTTTRSRLIIAASSGLTEVHSIHTEVEATAKLALFRKQLVLWKTDGVSFVTLEEIARANDWPAPKNFIRPLRRTSIPHRGGFVSTTI